MNCMQLNIINTTITLSVFLYDIHAPVGRYRQKTTTTTLFPNINTCVCAQKRMKMCLLLIGFAVKLTVLLYYILCSVLHRLAFTFPLSQFEVIFNLCASEFSRQYHADYQSVCRL